MERVCMKKVSRKDASMHSVSFFLFNPRQGWQREIRIERDVIGSGPGFAAEEPDGERVAVVRGDFDDLPFPIIVVIHTDTNRVAEFPADGAREFVIPVGAVLVLDDLAGSVADAVHLDFNG